MSSTKCVHCFWHCFCCILVCCAFISVVGGNTTSIQSSLFHNLTICEFNTTIGNFTNFVEMFALAPIMSHLVSSYFMTTAHFLDTCMFGTVVYFGYTHQRYVLTSVYAVCFLFGLGLFLYRLINNVRSWRYSCTRHTNFIVGTKGEFVTNRSAVLVETGGQVSVNGVLLTPKHVVLDGTKLTPIKAVHAEKWSS